LNSKSTNEEENAKKHLSKTIENRQIGNFEDIVGLLAHTAKEISLGFEDYNSHVLLYYH
jgi:hypothetical protein